MNRGLLKESGNHRPLRGAVIGYGFIAASGHIPSYLQQSLDDVEIVAVCDACPERLVLVPRVLPRARLYSHYQDLLQHEDRLDFVDVATPPESHFEIARASLHRGLHVLCEKPLTMRASEAQDLLVQARLRERVIFPCHNYKYAPVIQVIHEMLSQELIGAVRSVTLHTFRNTHAKGVPEWNPHWRRKKRWSGGGIAMDHGSHSFYLTFDWLKSYPQSVSARLFNQSQGRFDTEDQLTAILQFPEGTAHVHLSWTAGVRKVIYTLQGERGAIVVDDDDLTLWQMEATSGPDVAQGAVRFVADKRTISSHWMDASHVQWFSSLFEQFRIAIERRDYAGHSAQEALKCIQVIEAIYQSEAGSGVEIKLS